MIYFGIFLLREIEPQMSNLEVKYSADYCL